MVKQSFRNICNFYQNELRQIRALYRIRGPRFHLNNNGGKSSTADLVKWLTQNGYDFDAFKRLKPYDSIFKFDRAEVSLVEAV